MEPFDVNNTSLQHITAAINLPAKRLVELYTLQNMWIELADHLTDLNKSLVPLLELCTQRLDDTALVNSLLAHESVPDDNEALETIVSLINRSGGWHVRVRELFTGVIRSLDMLQKHH